MQKDKRTEEKSALINIKNKLKPHTTAHEHKIPLIKLAAFDTVNILARLIERDFRR